MRSVTTSSSSDEDEGVAFLKHHRAAARDIEDQVVWVDDEDLDIDCKRHRRPVIAFVRARAQAIQRTIYRRPLYAALRALKCLAVLLLAVIIATPIVAPSYTRLPPHYRDLKQRCEGTDAAPGCANPFGEQVFISISLYDQGGRLARGAWGEAILELIHIIGPKNVFLSIYENDSGADGLAALQEFKTLVPCRHEIVSDDHVSMDQFLNVTLPDGSQRTKRLAYLSEVRNRALRPIDRFTPETGIVRFDKVLFLNDVAFRPVDAAQLLFSTNVNADGRTNYLAACALDYRTPFLFYDVYAQRDAEGFSNGIPFFPIFTGAGQGLSRADMLAQRDAVRVQSCWGGMVAVRAKHLQHYTGNGSLPRPDFQDINGHVIDPAKPIPITAPVRFRFEPAVYFDACECCLLMADVAQAARRAGDIGEGVVVNPFVRVAYDFGTLASVAVVQRWERLFTMPHAVLSTLARFPRNNPYRTVGEGEMFREEVWEGGRWRLVERKARNGLFCGVREMQLIRLGERTGPINWEDTRIPSGQRLRYPT